MSMKGYRILLVWLLLLMLVVVFTWAAIPKILHPDKFARAVYNYHMLPGNLINLMAIYLPWLELVCAVLLLFSPRLRSGALVLIIAMLLMFIVAQSVAIMKGINVECGCFSTSAGSKKIGWLGIVMNIAWVLSAFICLKVPEFPSGKARIEKDW